MTKMSLENKVYIPFPDIGRKYNCSVKAFCAPLIAKYCSSLSGDKGSIWICYSQSHIKNSEGNKEHRLNKVIHGSQTFSGILGPIMTLIMYLSELIRGTLITLGNGPHEFSEKYF